MKKLIRAASAVALVALFAFGPTASAQTTTPTIDGTVTNGTKDAPAGGIPVSLQLFAAQGDLGVLDGTTDADGRFSFGDLPTGVAGYQVIADYGGATYRGVAQSYTPGTATNAQLTVYESTADPADVTYTEYIVWVDQTDNGFAVQHDLRFANAGNKGYIGKDGEVVTIDLPPGGANPQYLGTFLEYPGQVTGDTYVSDAPVVPGETTATLRFEVPSLSSLSIPLAFPASSFQLYVPQGIDVSSDLLRLEGTIADQGLTYSVYSAQNLPPQTQIDATLTSAQSGGAESTAVRTILAVAAILAALFIIVWFVRRRLTARPPKKTASKASTRPEPRQKVGAAAAAGNGHGPAPSDEDVDLIIDEIAALDLSFENGLLDERKYKRLRVAAKDRLLRAQAPRTTERVR